MIIILSAQSTKKSDNLQWPDKTKTEQIVSLLPLNHSILIIHGINSIQWVTLSFRNTKGLHQTLNPTAELWCKTLSRIMFGVKPRC